MLREALQETLPTYCTTPISVLHWETAIPPMEIILDQKHASARLRAHRLNNCHPVSRCLFRSQSFPVNTHLIHNVWPLLEEIEQMDPLLYPPWQTEKPGTIPNICPVLDKTDAAFQQWANNCPPLSMFLFTRLVNGPSRAGFRPIDGPPGFRAGFCLILAHPRVS